MCFARSRSQSAVSRYLSRWMRIHSYYEKKKKKTIIK